MTKKFKKQADFIVQLNEQVKDKENSLLKSRNAKLLSGEGGNRYRTSTKVIWLLSGSGVLLLILRVSNHLQRKWERQKALEEMFRGEREKELVS